MYQLRQRHVSEGKDGEGRQHLLRSKDRLISVSPTCAARKHETVKRLKTQSITAVVTRSMRMADGRCMQEWTLIYLAKSDICEADRKTAACYKLTQDARLSKRTRSVKRGPSIGFPPNRKHNYPSGSFSLTKGISYRWRPVRSSVSPCSY